jgi:type I restriction enzyme S subunit
MFVSLCLIKPIKSIVKAQFISFAFAGGLLERQLSEITKTTSVTNLHLDKIRTLIIPIPPLNEQDDILSRTEKELKPTNAATARTEREIALLREHRTTWTADVVTGLARGIEPRASRPSN